MKPLTFAIHSAIRCIVATLSVGAISGTCTAAPQQLLGKSIHVLRTMTITAQRPNGDTYSSHVMVENEIYISTLGRIFARRKTGSNTQEQSPDDRPIELLSWRIEGTNLVATETANGLQHVSTISFDTTFRTCRYSHQYKVVDVSMNRATNRVRSITVDSSACAIQEGNPFAN